MSLMDILISSAAEHLPGVWTSIPNTIRGKGAASTS